MHREPKQFVASVKKQYPEYFTGKKVLEVGSLDINGSVRPFFTDCDYTGIDLGNGPGVDRIAHVVAYLEKFSEVYDVVISTETLEHDAKWGESLKSMYRLLKPSGILIVTCAAPNRPEHGTTLTGSAEASPFTSDYYRNISVEDFASILPARLFFKSYLGYRGNMDDLYFAGIKQGVKFSVIGVDATPRGAKFARADYPPVLEGAGLTELIQQRGAMRFPDITEQFEIAKQPTVTAEISTKDRYHFLSLTISAILNQTHKPDKLVIYDDGEQKDLRTLSPFDGLLRLADHLGIAWTVFTTPREGQVRNHQHCLDTCETDLIFRCDDDCIPEPDCLEKLLAEMIEGVGAVAPLIHHPCGVTRLPKNINGSLGDVTLGLNIQWCDWNGGPRYVDHLYSGFLFSIQAARKAGGYPKGLSCIGHHEETIFSHSIKRAGFTLKVIPSAKMYHFHESTGGIRSFTDWSLWEHDEKVYQEYLRTWGLNAPEKLIVIDAGIGDHLVAKAILPRIQKAHQGKNLVLAVCYESVFEDVPDIELISIAEAKSRVGDRYGSYSLYQWCWDNNKTSQPLAESMVEFWSK